MESYIAQSDTPLIFVPKFREFGLRILDGGSSYLVISFCPWCGKQLPSSMRDKWFDAIEELGLNPENIDSSSTFASDVWWKTIA